MSAQALKPVPAYEDGTLRLADGRVTLRRPLAEDAAAVAGHMNDFDVVKNLSRAPWPYTRADAESWLAGIAAEAGPRGAYPFAIVTGGALAGVVGISTNPANPGEVELGYWLGRPFWGQGYATQAARLAVRSPSRRWTSRFWRPVTSPTTPLRAACCRSWVSHTPKMSQGSQKPAIATSPAE